MLPSEVIDIPDYSETLGEIASNVEDAAEALEKLASSPMLVLTPEQVALQISQAGKDVRAADHGALTRAQTAMDGGRGVSVRRWRRRAPPRPSASSLSGRAVSECWWAQWPGRYCPAPLPRITESWHLSERMAARTLGGNMWNGGERLLQAADPDRWQDVLTGSQIMHDNREKIGECRKAKSGE